MASLHPRKPLSSGRWTLVVVVAAASSGGLMVAACAAGDIAGGGAAGVGASGNAGGGTGASSTTSTTSGSGGTGAGTTSSTTSSSSFGGAGGAGPCTEDPCRLTPPQCGCPQGQKCTFNSGVGAYCVDDGTIAGGQQCLGSGCMAGYICVGYGDPPDLCRQFCDDDTDCDPPGGVCVIELSGSGSFTATLCSDACNPVTSAECTVSGTGCVVLDDDGPPARSYTQCVPAGTATQGQGCSGFGDCAPGLGCFTVGSNSICLTYCNRSAPQCPVGSCNAITPPALVGSTEYGVCQ